MNHGCDLLLCDIQEAPNHWCHVVLFKYVGGGTLTRPASTTLTKSQEEENTEQQEGV